MKHRTESNSDPMFDDSHTTYPSMPDRKELEAVIELERLELYNTLRPCGAEALRRHLATLGVKNVPSARSIGRILKQRHLPHAGSLYRKGN